jgi:NAD-dependent deacetylase
VKKKIVFFTGAGISAESGVSTFRDEDGLWYNNNIDDVASITGWLKNPKKVLDFYNTLREKLPSFQPNHAHLVLSNLEKEYDVTIITQNVDDLHERAGSSNIIHLHGELTKARGTLYDHKPSPFDVIHDIGYNEINMGDICNETNSQLRPHIVWFGEYPFGVEEATNAIMNADILIIVGTSLQITYTIPMLMNVKNDCSIYYIDPEPSMVLSENGLNVNYICKKACEGINDFLLNIY